MQPASFTELVAGIITLVALCIVGYVAVASNNLVALGALIGVIAAANGFFLRGKVQPPTPPDPVGVKKF